jgi:hypothetical protein
VADPRRSTLAASRLDYSQRFTTGGRLRPLAVEALIREARAAGYDGPQRKLVRLIRTYVDARETCAFAVWLTYQDHTGDAAAWHADRQAGGRHG